MTTLLHHRLDGPEGAPPLILGPSLGTSLAVWEPSVPELARTHRVLRFDLPGHGGSPVTVLPAGTTTVADLARLVLDLADHHGWQRFAYAGISLGGAIGAYLALHHPDRVESLAMICSSARFGEPQGWADRAQLVRTQGTKAVADATPARWFTASFAGSDRAKALIGDLVAANDAGYAACCDALSAYDLRADLPRIAVPTLVVAGRDDPATPPAHARELADGIPGASLLEVAGAAHLANVEKPEVVTAALAQHFGPAVSGDRTRHAAGMIVRRAVLGDAHVDRAGANTTRFTADFQDFITRYAWGEIWTRPGLDRRTRSCITMTALVAHGHLDELAMHVRAALRNGLTPEEIGEVLLQVGVYCGVPAANAAFAVAQRTLREEGVELEPLNLNDPSGRN
ncbi:3-oxoadipate enol-lactonase [Planosporangium flavigriseum]|uniref:3-oxoadipate enol-lactonase n=1 Tax=Planosporangium flavigriseum TaxID=373681 RepID=A0A8J3LZ27_9ACTN|nr:3-oxoadipate enol-lactonase [Planosporangium flavigriseum]NJC67738.1 3-oxoadipate enol-lactonase [Planosporangium flavigriseum]GIG76015.1 3-oxoadipate enol-lactonase [Planosporangium flavigriseum]